ncbi:hypothetical protein DP49_5457 [Burkholderia pseudomallei]|nr:hypothetical protein DP49_5457 [Burkholderia pseudomallei]
MNLFFARANPEQGPRGRSFSLRTCTTPPRS